MEIVYVFIGKLPHYIVETIYQTRLYFEGKITVICDDLESPYIEKLKEFNVNIVDQRKYRNEDFLNIVQYNLKKFCIADKLGDRKLLFIRSFERFYVLEKYMQQNNCENILFLELDVLIYFDPDEFLPTLKQRDLSVSYVYANHMCTGICYVKNSSILKNLTDYFCQYILNAGPNYFLNEMSAIGDWIQIPENRARTWILPSLWKDERYNPQIYEHFQLFNKTLFDGAGIAIAIDGPDETHRQQWIENGKVWWGTEVKYNEFTYEWKTENGLRVLFAKPTADSTESYKVQCLHVHNKNLAFFLSKNNTKRILLNYDTYPIIHGDRFLKLANIVLRKKSRTDYYEVRDYSKSNILYFEDIPEVWNNPSLFFCNTEDACEFQTILDKLQNPFVLLTHNSDENVTEKYSFLYNHPKLVHWFTQNLCISHPKLSFLPIGIANPTWQHGDYLALTSIREHTIPKSYPIYANFLIETNRTAREYCAKVLTDKGIPIHPRCHPYDNWVHIAGSYYCICPDGNGVDTHRFWESLYLRTIPIVLRNPLSEQLAKEYPCILLEKWEDLDISILKRDVSILSQELFTKLSFQTYAKKIENTLNTLLN